MDLDFEPAAMKGLHPRTCYWFRLFICEDTGETAVQHTAEPVPRDSLGAPMVQVAKSSAMTPAGGQIWAKRISQEIRIDGMSLAEIRRWY